MPLVVATAVAGCSGGGKGAAAVMPAGDPQAKLSRTGGTTSTPTYASVVLTDTPAAYYQLADSTATLVDSSGHNAGGVYGPGVTRTSGIVPGGSGYGHLFPGGSWLSNNLAWGPYGVAGLQPRTITVEAWVKPAAGSAGTALVSYGNNQVGAPYAMSMEPGDGKFVFATSVGGSIRQAVSQTTPASGSTYYVAGTYDGSALRLYVNGSLEATTSAAGAIGGYDASNGLAIGAGWMNSAGQNGFGGVLSDVAIYSGALAATRIQAHYTSGKSVAPSPSPSPSPSPVPTVAATPGAAPSVVQYFTYQTAASRTESASTIALGSAGSAGHAPAAGDVLVALVGYGDTGAGAAIGAPTGFAAANGGVVSNAFAHQAVYSGAVGTSAPSSLTFTFNEPVSAQIWVVEVAGTSGVDIVTSGTGGPSASPWNTTTGTGTQSGLNDLGLVFASVADAILTANSISGYTQLGAALGNHGDGTSSWGATAAVYRSNAPLTGASVPAQAVGWSQGSGTEPVLGAQVLLRPAAGVPPAGSPSPTSAPTAAPTAVPTAAPKSTPTPAPTATPTPQPTAAPVSGPGSFTLGIDWATSWTPFGSTSPWNRKISSNPTVASGSSAWINAQFPGGSNNTGTNLHENEAGPYDYGHPVYYASTSDPLVKVSCNPSGPCDTADNGGIPSQIYVPAGARPAGGDDSHMAIFQPNGNEIDFWAVTKPSGNWTTGSTLAAGGGANCGSYTSGLGWDPNNNGWPQTAAASCLSGGLLRANEMASGSINHAIAIVLQCAVGSQYPAPNGAATDTCSSGVGPPLGGRMWYDVPDATTNAIPTCSGGDNSSCLWPWEKAILNALHDYGGYLMDDVAGGSGVYGMGFTVESGQPAYSYGKPDPFASSSLGAQGWSSFGVGALAPRYQYGGAHTDSNGNWNLTGVAGINFNAHMHWLAVCSAQGSC